ncbi:hypothetical protein BKI51_02515 [Alphaproteobacteria bacterium AO1-B]|nr:hypothetical protein BKI51_02515 [Alphaproteobacteria bacterium AO1-B]
MLRDIIEDHNLADVMLSDPATIKGCVPFCAAPHFNGFNGSDQAAQQNDISPFSQRPSLQ